ncbi:ThiF family adenylyltransferase [Rheinheimera hassiensis]|uniref:ThiF family adenylyltransferase n=1 Tax=Rheinheimera hassiensis TaxID=1193627 RepID=UPI001F0555B7|nr:ThiF family adenylyltransferase [Rheinheimera hassiensis]
MVDLSVLTKLPEPIQQGVRALFDGFGPHIHYVLSETKTNYKEVIAFQMLLPLDYLGVQRHLRIGFPEKFPQQNLILKVAPDAWLKWPHTFENSICLYGAGEHPSSLEPIDLVHEAIKRLRLLIGFVAKDACPISRQKEFEREISTYWNQQLTRIHQTALLLRIPKKSCALYTLSDAANRSLRNMPTWFAEEVGVLKNHASKSSKHTVRTEHLAQSAYYLALSSVPSIEIPKSEQLLQWLSEHINGTELSNFQNWLGESSKYSTRWVFLKLPETNPPKIQTLIIRGMSQQDKFIKFYGHRTAKRSKTRDNLIIHPTLHTTDVYTLEPSVIHSRNNSVDLGHVATKKIVMVGAGTLGSFVALQLAKFGIQRLTIIDPDKLSDANLGRHVLGIPELGQNKAEAMRSYLLRNMPCEKVNAVPTYLQFALYDKPSMLDDADVVVITTADWDSEKYLWELKSQGATWELVQAWTEPQAYIGHAIVSDSKMNDGRYLFEPGGRFKQRLSDWKKGGVIPLPGCGESFIPSGPVGVIQVASMVADIVIKIATGRLADAAWFSMIKAPSTIETLGGEYLGPQEYLHTNLTILSRAWPDDVS